VGAGTLGLRQGEAHQLSIALGRYGHRRIIAAKTPGPRSC
jgi:hypothetical protein